MTDRTPTGDLRERLAEALTREHYRRARERIEASPEEHCAAFADAVLSVVEAETAALRQRAEEAERERDDYRQRFTNQMAAADELIRELRRAERLGAEALDAVAAERRGRLAAEAANRRVRALCWRGPGPDNEYQIWTVDVLAALDAEPQSDEALDLLAEFVDDRPCDPHPGNGFCQTHCQRPPCPHAAARRLLAALDAEQPKESPPGQESAVPVDWEAIVRQRERELKREGEARHQAETAVQRVQAYALWCDQHDVEPDTRTINALIDGTDTYPYSDHIDPPKDLAALDAEQPKETP